MCAGEMLRLAGCSSGTGVCARGGLAAGKAFLVECLRSDHACCLTLSAKQDGLREVAFSVPPWVGIAGKYVLAAA